MPAMLKALKSTLAPTDEAALLEDGRTSIGYWSGRSYAPGEQQVDTEGTTQVLAPFGVSSVLQKLGCARVIAAPQTMGSLPPPGFDEVLRLERGAYLAPDTDERAEAWLVAELDRRRVEVIVLSARAMGNRRLKAALRASGFLPVQVAQQHTILRRPPRP